MSNEEKANQFINEVSKKFCKSLLSANRLKKKIVKHSSVFDDIEFMHSFLCFNNKKQLIGNSTHSCICMNDIQDFHGLDDDWDEEKKQRKFNTCYVLHDIESHWRSNFFEGAPALNLNEISHIELHVTVFRQKFFPVPINAKYSKLQEQLIKCEQWLKLQPETFCGFDTIFSGFIPSPAYLDITLNQTAYCEKFNKDCDVAMNLRPYLLRQVKEKDINPLTFFNFTSLKLHGVLDTDFFHQLSENPYLHIIERVDGIWVDLKNRYVLTTAIS